MDDLNRSKEDLIAELRQLRQQNKEFILGRDALWEVIPSALVIIRGSDKKFIYLNQHAKNLYGTDYSGDDLNTHMKKVNPLRLDGTPLPLKETAIYQSLTYGKTVIGMEMVIQNINEERKTVLVSSSSLRDEQDKIIAAIVILEDITERKHAETALQESKKLALNFVDKLRRVNQQRNEFINILSHELRNPLTSAMMGVDLIDMQHESGEVKKTNKIVRRQLKQLNHMVDDLMDVARITENRITLNKEEVDLNQLVRNAIEDYQWQFAEKGVILNSEFTEPLKLSADSVRMTQAVGNLLNNSLKFTETGNVVYVSVSQSEDKRDAMITVRDTGIGIDQEALSYLFEPLLQVDKSLDRKNGGLGLGLAITKGIVELHGGTVEVTSDGLGEGTQSIIRLPIPYTVEAYSSETGKEDGLRILVIDDMPDITEIMTALLEHLGHEVITAESGFEGIAKAKVFHPHILFCDIGLPGISGYEVAEFFTADEELKDTHLIAFSGYSQPEDRERSKEAGFKAHLAKPVEMEVLKSILLDYCKMKS